jgi:ribosomal protein L37AE/L43A
MLKYCEKNINHLDMFFDDCGKCQYCREEASSFTDELICPYCGDNKGGDHAIQEGDTAHWECSECDNKFEYRCFYYVKFIATQIKKGVVNE